MDQKGQPHLIARRTLLRLATLSVASLAVGLGACTQAPAATPTAKPVPPAAPTTAPAAGAAATTAPAAAAAATTAPAAAKTGGQTLWGLAGDPLGLDPHKAGIDAVADVLPQFYESLTTYDSALRAAPALALSWEVPDPKTYIWKLRQGVKFHDGSEFTADSVKYSIERMLAPETGNLWKFTFDSIEQVSVVDKYTVKMSTSRPD